MSLIEQFKGKSLHPKFKTKLVLSFMTIIFLMMIVSYLFVYYGILNIFESQTEQFTLEQFSRVDSNIGNLKNNVDRIIKMTVIEPDVQVWLSNDFTSQKDEITAKNNLLKRLTYILDNNSYIDSIFIYGNNGEIFCAIPSQNIYYNDVGKKNTFYNPERFNKVFSQRIPTWIGAYKPDFSFLDFDSSRLTAHYSMSDAMPFSSIDNYEQKAVLVINVNEKYFSTIFNTPNATQSNGLMYVTNEDGMIISHSDEKKIGEKSSTYPLINTKKQMDSLIISRNEEKIQLIYYRLQNPGWILIREQPFNVFINNIIKLRMTLLIVALISLLCVFLVSLYWIYQITKPLDRLLSAMNQLRKGKLGVKSEISRGNEFDTLGNQFDLMSKSIVSLVEEVKTKEVEKRRLEIETLQAQINPHFLYNTINTIKWMAIIADQKNISNSLSALGNLLRPVFSNHSPECTIFEEIDYVNNYIKLMNCRFGECIQVKIEVPEAIEKFIIPRFILQPLLENSIVHGISDSESGINIEISVVERVDCIVIRICDNGKGINQEVILEINQSLVFNTIEKSSSTESIGVSNVNRRIKLQSGENYGISIESEEGKGTRVEIRLPLKTSINPKIVD